MKYLYYITFFSIFKLFSFNCIPNKNCQKNKGECYKNKCYCYEEFWTLKTEKDSNNPNFIYCDYAKQSRLSPLLLEFFIPIGLSHYFWGSKKLFFLKIFLIGLPVTLIIIGFCKFKSKNSQNFEENIKNIKNEEELNLISNDETNNNIKEIEEKKNISNKNEAYSSDDGNDSVNISGNLHSANHNRIPINPLDSFILIIEVFFTLCYFIMHIIDLVGYFFGIYKDENNVPFSNIF